MASREQTDRFSLCDTGPRGHFTKFTDYVLVPRHWFYGFHELNDDGELANFVSKSLNHM